MDITHVVAQGEYLSLIAARFGFRDHLVIWDLPANAALKQLRKNPNVLLPGDKVVIPVRAAGQAAAATGQVNAFIANASDVLVNLVFEDPSRTPMRDRAGQLTVGVTSQRGSGFLTTGPRPATTDAAGRFPLIFRNALEQGALPTDGAFVMDAAGAAPRAAFRFLVGSLDPLDTKSGQRARLNNLGYFAGFGDLDDDQLLWAIEEFQADEKLTDRGLTGTIAKDRRTLNRLGQRHGDLLAGEEL